MRNACKLIWLVVAPGLLACSGAPLDAPTDDRSSPVVNGMIDEGDPAVAFLWFGGSSCSGTLISPRVILTAAHCVQGASVSGTEVFFGTQADGAGTWVAATNLDAHPSGDIAAITLAEPGPAKPIPLYKETLVAADEGRSVRMVGFGVTFDSGSDSGIKREGMSELYDWDQEILYFGATGSSVCYGDSGGPGFFDVGGVEHVAGVASFVTDACGYGLSGEARVDVFQDWIEAYMEAEDPPTCDADVQCAAGCTAPDPDCPCAADGHCTAACPDLASDADCAGCGPGDTCRSDCPALDADCCAADGSCEPACGAADPDCDDPGDPVDPGSGDPDDDVGGHDGDVITPFAGTRNAPLEGSVCSATPGRATTHGACWALLLLAMGGVSRRRTRLPR